MSRLLLGKFRSFIDPDAKTRHHRVISILRKFDYVMTTENLDRQVATLMSELSLPKELERRRVAEKKVALEAEDSDIQAQNQLDIEVFEAANTVLTDLERHNPFGFDAVGRAEAVARVVAASEPRKAVIASAYGDLAQSLCNDLRAEAALAKLASPQEIALDDPSGFREILAARWAEAQKNLTKRQHGISTQRLRQWRSNNPN